MKTFAAVAVLLALAAAADARVLHTRTVPPEGWALREMAAANEPVSFIVAMKQQNLDQLEERFWAVSDPTSPQYRQFMSVDEINDVVRPTQDTRRRVLAWLSTHVNMYNVEDRVDSFKVTTTASKAEQMLNTQFRYFHHHASNRTVVRQMGDYGIPSALDELIDLVAGVSEFPDMTRIHKRQAANGFTGVVPQTLTNMYNAKGSKASRNTNSSVGVIEWEQQYYSPSDLASFATQTNTDIPALAPKHVVGQNQGGSPGDEAQLDIEWALASGLGAEGWFWINGADAWVLGWATAFFQTPVVPYVVSMSYGWAEDAQCQQGIGGAECGQLGINSKQYVDRSNTEFQKIGLRGVSLFASSGDSGANGRTDGFCSQKHLNPTFPAASPYVTAVGATQVEQAKVGVQNPPPVCTDGSVSCVETGVETAVSYNQAHFASGGGFSNIADTPKYQQDAVNTYLSSGVALPPSSYYNKNGRGYPDVSAFGSAITIVFQGSVQSVGGTSCSSPIFAGYAALLNDIALQADNKPLGFLNPLLYKIHQDAPSSFNDITKGSNECTEDGCGFGGSCKGYKASAGWDPVTGLGSPNYNKLANYVRQML